MKRALDRSLSQNLTPASYSYGKAFEHFIILEILRLADYYRQDVRLSYVLTKDGGEIDLIVERTGSLPVLVEIKSATTCHAEDTTFLQAFAADFGPCEAFCLSQDQHERDIKGVKYRHWRAGFGAILKVRP